MQYLSHEVVVAAAGMISFPISLVFRSRGPPPWGWGASRVLNLFASVPLQQDAEIREVSHGEKYHSLQEGTRCALWTKDSAEHSQIETIYTRVAPSPQPSPQAVSTEAMAVGSVILLTFLAE